MYLLTLTNRLTKDELVVLIEHRYVMLTLDRRFNRGMIQKLKNELILIRYAEFYQPTEIYKCQAKTIERVDRQG